MTPKSTKTSDGWHALDLNDPELRRLIAREEFVEGFLNSIDEIMGKRGVSRARLADLMGCSRSNISQIMRSTRNLTAEKMVDIAFAMDLKLTLDVEESRWSKDVRIKDDSIGRVVLWPGKRQEDEKRAEAQSPPPMVYCWRSDGLAA